MQLASMWILLYRSCTIDTWNSSFIPYLHPLYNQDFLDGAHVSQRCDSTSSLLRKGCREEFIQSPRVKVEVDATLSSTQVAPRKISIQLRPGTHTINSNITQMNQLLTSIITFCLSAFIRHIYLPRQDNKAVKAYPPVVVFLWKLAFVLVVASRVPVEQVQFKKRDHPFV